MTLPVSDPLASPAYAVQVNGQHIQVHGAKSCQAPWPFKVFCNGERPDIKLARPDAWGGPAQIGPSINKIGFGDWEGCAPALLFEAVRDGKNSGPKVENVHLENVTLFGEVPTRDYATLTIGVYKEEVNIS